MQITSTMLRAALALVLSLGLLALQAAAANPARSESPGKALFQTYCASCHGVHGEGNGPVSAALLTKPPDLTKLTKKLGIPLDRERLAQFIDGRLDVLAHGPREMPVWGERFKEELDPGLPATEDTTRRIIDRIIDYLVSIQSVQGAAREPAAESSSHLHGGSPCTQSHG